MKHIGNNIEEAALKKSNLGYVLVLIAALMWGTIGIFVIGPGCFVSEHGGLSPVVGCCLNGSGLGIHGLPGRCS